MTTSQALIKNFLGNSPVWYKQAIVLFLILNPILLVTAGPVVTGWILIFEFIFTLALALKCYPLQPGGLLAIEAIIIGLAGPETVYHEVQANLEVILLLMFMVAGIYFMQSMLLWTFTKLLLNVRSKMLLSLMFSLFAAILSAFLDALTVTAVLISVGVGFYAVYHKVASGKHFHHDDHDHGDDDHVHEDKHETLAQFRAFLRSLLMHGAVGTALGGVCTLVGEPQNLLIAQKAGWDFVQFFLLMAPVTMPVLVAGLLTCMALEKLKWFDYGSEIPASVRKVLEDYSAEQDKKQTKRDKMVLMVQVLVALFLVMALAFHLAAVGLIGLTVIILLTAFNGIVEEHQIGKAFEEALPFTALLVVFFAIVSVIHEQHLFQPIIAAVLEMDEAVQPGIFFIANGFLSAISDNVFVATVYINEVVAALEAGTISREQFDLLAIAINTGTNIPSVATPNGQAAFLFLLTSALAPLIRLSYGKMVWMALPYTIVMSLVGYFAVTNFL
ncbi:sodium/proton antiporter NhaB [Amphritea sp. HPY]|uniref:sodium/proton antiporter NhaB n=1 Tax=Amphritea sp. HPY TaxID=3421652 RepID=UPI003D7F1869